MLRDNVHNSWPYETISSGFLVRHVMTVRSQFHCADYDDPCARAAQSLSEHGFSFAPVSDDDGEIIGIVSAGALRRAATDQNCQYVVDTMQQLDLENTVQADAPLIELFEWLVQTPFNIALAGRQVVGLVHLSDLNKEPVRGLLHLLVACVERRMAALIRHEFDGDDWLNLLSAGRRQEITRRSRSHETTVDIDPLQTTFLWDLTTVVLKSQIEERLQQLLDWSLSEHLGGLCELRNVAAHPVRPVLEKPDDLPQLMARCRRARNVVHAAAELLGDSTGLP